MTSKYEYYMAFSRARLFGVATYMLGFGFYLWLITASILKLRVQKLQTSARRILLPYAIISLLISCALAATTLAKEQSSLSGIIMTGPDLAPIYAAKQSLFSNIEAALSTLLVIVNDALYVYRTNVLFGRKPLTVILSYSYLALVVGISLAIYSIAANNKVLLHILFNLSLGVTIAFNIVLTLLISARLVLARRSMALMGVHNKGLASQYITINNIVVESAAIWVLSAILHLACLNAFQSRTHMPDDPLEFSALFPFFSSLFEITSALSPALLLYRIAYNMQYTPDAVGMHRERVQPAGSQWPNDTENQVIEPSIGAVPQTSTCPPSLSMTAEYLNSNIYRSTSDTCRASILSKNDQAKARESVIDIS